MSRDLISYIPEILKGLWNTTWIAFLSIILALLPGWLLVLGRTSKNRFINILCYGYVLFFDGVPFLVQLYFSFFVLPGMIGLFISEVVVALVLLSLNVASDISKYSALFLKNRENLNLPNSIKITLLALVTEFGEVVKLITLVSSIGLVDLYKVGKGLLAATANGSIMITIIIIYLIISIVVKICTHYLGKKLFPKAV